MTLLEPKWILYINSSLLPINQYHWLIWEVILHGKYQEVQTSVPFIESKINAVHSTQFCVLHKILYFISHWYSD